MLEIIGFPSVLSIRVFVAGQVHHMFLLDMQSTSIFFLSSVHVYIQCAKPIHVGKSLSSLEIDFRGWNTRIICPSCVRLTCFPYVYTSFSK
jgi:hypothetical protein